MPEDLLIIPGVPKSKRARSAPGYEERVREVARLHFPRPLRGRGLSVEVYHFYTTGNRLDLDNLLKTLFDGLKGAAYEDDAQIDQLSARRYNMNTSPYIENVLEEWIDLLREGRDFVSVIIRH